MAAMNPSNQQASMAVPLRAAMNPMLLALACSGSRKELEEACLREPSLLEGVTVEGDTALHAVASYGDSANFLKSADFIFGKAKDLLFLRNNNRDTPLHCAARAGSPHMIYRLIGFATSVGRAKEFLVMENKLGETALHEAVRIRSNGIVKQLMEEDPELASIPRDGASPLYLAVLFEDKTIAETLYAKSAAGMLSYSGPNGQNALHAGVLRGEVMTEMLLNWKKDLAKQADQMGSTPLHIAASLTGVGGAFRWTFSRTFPWVFQKWHSGVPIKPLVHADPYQLYQPDREGLFPIHVAAASGLYGTTNTMITEYPEIAGQRDSKGRTFIHVAAELKRGYFVAKACCTPLLAWILNMRDNDGNTALHLAVQLGDLDSFCYLLMNKKVRLDLTNNNGETPLDISRTKLPTGYSYGWNAVHLIDLALTLSQARHGYHLRYDQLRAQHFRKNKPEDEVNESNKLTNSTQTMLIGSVLIATVTFGASFTVPGGYNNGGTPTLSGRYIFDAFMMANTIAFLLSAAATINLMYAGMVMADLRIRRLHFNIATYCAFCAVTSLGAAFALGAYLTLAPAAHMTAIAICALVFLISLFGYTEPVRGIAIGRALHVRMGSKAYLVFTRIISMRTLSIYWPLVVIFGSAAISTKYGHKQMT